MNLTQLRPIRYRTEDLKRDVKRYSTKELNKTDRQELTEILETIETLMNQVKKMESRKTKKGKGEIK